MQLIAIASDTARSELLGLFIGALLVSIIVQFIFRRLEGGVFTTVRTATALALAAAFYCGGLAFIFPSTAILDSFDRPHSVEDVQDPQKLFSLLQAQHSALVQSIKIQESSAHALSLVGLFTGFSGLAFLWRMRSTQKELAYFQGQGHRDSNADPEL